MTPEEEKKVHNEAAKLCKEIKSLIERTTKENKLEDIEYCDNQLNELESKYSVEAVIYVIENCYKPFKVMVEDNGKYTIRPMVWYNIGNCEPNTLLSTAMKINTFLKQNELL